MKLKICDDDDPGAEFNATTFDGHVGVISRIPKPEPTNDEIANSIWPEETYIRTQDLHANAAGILNVKGILADIFDAVDAKIKKALEGRK
jgi:hypothetical protein